MKALVAKLEVVTAGEQSDKIASCLEQITS